MCLARGDFLNASFQHNPGHIPGPRAATPVLLTKPGRRARRGGSDRIGARRARLRLVEGQPAAHRLDPRRRRLILAPWYCRPPRIPRRVVTDHLLVHFKPLLVHLKYLARS